MNGWSCNNVVQNCYKLAFNSETAQIQSFLPIIPIHYFRTISNLKYRLLSSIKHKAI